LPFNLDPKPVELFEILKYLPLPIYWRNMYTEGTVSQ